MVLNEEQQLLRDTIAAFLDEHAPIEALRTLRDTPNSPAWDTELWQQLCELGAPAAAMPEEHGGLGFRWLGFGALLAETGRRLSVTPLLSSIAAAGSLIHRCGSHEQSSHWLPQLASGEVTATVALQEGRHFHPTPKQCTAVQGTISGSKTLVMDASQANYLLVSVALENTETGIAMVASDAPGVTINEQQLFDGRKYATVTLNQVTPTTWLEGDVAKGLGRALDEATLALCAEMMGGARETLDRTVAYLNEREQFGVKIGSFQALQHRCAQAYCQLELAESTLLAALTAIDRGADDIADVTCRTKALVGDCYDHITNEAVQLHGGMGVTDEMDIGLFLKRARVCQQLFGTSDYHRQRFASLRGF